MRIQEWSSSWENDKVFFVQNGESKMNSKIIKLSLNDQDGNRIRVLAAKWLNPENQVAEFKMVAIIKLIMELVWVRVRVRKSVFEWIRVFESKMAESNMAEFKMAAIIKLSQNESVKFFLCKMAESKMMAGRIQDGCHHQVESEWMSFESDWTSLSQSFVQNGWIQDGRIQDGSHSRWLPSLS